MPTPKRPLSSPENLEGQQSTKMAHLVHSPRKPKGEREELLASIQSMMGVQTEKINASIDGLRLSVENRFQDLEEKLEKVIEENADLKKRNADLEQRMTSLELEGRSQATNMPGRLLQLERDARRRNIVATGIDFETPQEGFEKLNQMIGAVTNDQIRVMGLRAFKPKSGRGMIVAECGTIEDKQCILRAKKQFVMTVGEEKHPVYVDSDLPQEDRLTQSKLRGIAKEMRAQGKDVRMAFGKLKVDGEWLHFNPAKNDVGARSFRKEH